MASEGTVYKFSGSADEYLHGVPARDLTQADVDALDDSQRAELEANVALGRGAAIYRVPKGAATSGDPAAEGGVTSEK